MQTKTRGIVLTETPYSETSKILNVLTEDYGLIGIISKGCKVLKSKLRGVSNKMNYCEYTINYKENGLSTLIEGSNINSFKSIYTDMKKATYAFFLMDLISQVLKENNNKDIFKILVSSLTKINDGLSPELISIIVEVKLLDYLGVGIELDNCVICGNSDNILTIDLTSGGVVCKSCFKEGYVMNNKALHLIQLLKKIDIEKLDKLEITDEDIFIEIDKFIHEYYASYTGIYINKSKFI